MSNDLTILPPQLTELADAINAEHSLVANAFHTALEHAERIGRLLKEANKS